MNKFICCDALSGLKKLTNNSATLVLTSPPYGKVRKSYNSIDPDEYVDWFLPISKEIYRVLTVDGSFILNINDSCKNKEKIPYPFELVVRLREEIGFKYIDTNIFLKTNGAPAAGKRRADYFEYIFHFAKTVDPKWYPDRIREPYAPTSLKRAEKPIKVNVSNRETRQQYENKYKKWNLNTNGAYPKNVLLFPKDRGKDEHPAPFHEDLPKHYILSHTDENDLVVDPFAGRGTTAAAAKQLNRKYYCFDIEQRYVDLGKLKYDL